MFSPEISNENKGSRGWGWNCLDCLPSMHMTWGLSCSTTVFTAGQATLGRLRHNDISDFPRGQDYTHNKILCQMKAKQRTESQLKRSSCFPTFWIHYKLQVTFYSCFGFGAEDSNQGFTHAKYSCYPWTTHTPSPASTPLFQRWSRLIRLVSSIFRAEVPLQEHATVPGMPQPLYSTAMLISLYTH